MSNITIAIEWKDGKPQGAIDISTGRLESADIINLHIYINNVYIIIDTFSWILRPVHGIGREKYIFIGT